MRKNVEATLVFDVEADDMEYALQRALDSLQCRISGASIECAYYSIQLMEVVPKKKVCDG